MKKLLSVALAIIMVCALALTACAEEAGMANPWVETDAETLATLTGAAMNLPEGAEDTVYSYSEELGMGEILFMLDDALVSARMAAQEQPEDISGMYYEWQTVEDGTVGEDAATVCSYVGDGECADMVLWYDPVAGITYAVSAISESGMDVVSVANAMYIPAEMTE